MDKKKTFNKIARGIKEVKIQGARNVARKALYAYSLIPTEKSREILCSLRPTEPMLVNVLNKIQKQSYAEVLKHFDEAQEKINRQVIKLIKSGDVVFTHCHSTNVTGALIYAREHGKNFEVYNTETRPLFQGRRTAKELKKSGIEVTMFVDSALGIALSEEQETKKVSKIFIGSDAITKEGIVNKVGSEVVAQIAKNQKIPLYIVADSWKFSKEKVPMEQRELNEVWDKAPKKIKIKNPAFEFIPKKYIKAIISDLGNLTYTEFLKKVKI